MKNLFFLKKMYCKNDLRPLLYMYPLFSGQKVKIGKTTLKRSQTGEKVGTGLYAQPYLLTLGKNFKDKSCQVLRFKHP